MQVVKLERYGRQDNWTEDRDISRGILEVSTLRQGRKGLQIEQGVEAMLVEAMFILLQAMSCLLNADGQKNPSTGHSTFVKEFEAMTQYWIKDSQSREALRQKKVDLAERLRSHY